MDIKELLNYYYNQRNHILEISVEKPDPILVAREYIHHEFFEEIALICAFLSYGNAKQIVFIIKQLPFNLLQTSLDEIERFNFPLYRFQKSKDIQNLFKSIYKLIHEYGGIKSIFLKGYKEKGILEGINLGIKTLRSISEYSSNGFDFLVGKPIGKIKGVSPLKRWNMYLRWMVREDYIDFGRWKEIDKSKLIIPLDTHTFKVSHKLGLLKRKTYDLYSAFLLTEALKRFDPNDPVKYDFALYRLGQEKAFIQI